MLEIFIKKKEQIYIFCEERFFEATVIFFYGFLYSVFIIIMRCTFFLHLNCFF